MDSESFSPTLSAAEAPGYPFKRARHSPPSPSDFKLLGALTAGDVGKPSGSKKESAASSFRNVSACNRCRLRKNRCDQELPSCASCEKARVKCIGYDPIMKREIPRSYVFYLESRVAYLEDLLKENNVAFDAAEILESITRSGLDSNGTRTPTEGTSPANGESTAPVKYDPQDAARYKKQDDEGKLNKLVNNIGSVSVQGASDSRYLGSTSGISFARVVFAAVKSSVSGANSDRSGVRPSRPPPVTKAIGNGGTSMRDSFFGLHTKPTIKQAPFPDKELGERLVNFYFEHANPQIPILHRGEFMKTFELAYVDGDKRVRTSRELYMLNIVFAIGSGIFLGEKEESDLEKERKRRTVAGRQCQPEEYHASAIVHLESCLSVPSAVGSVDGFGGGLEELQAVLLLAGFALLRPVAPGLWYIVGVAVRLAVDLGLHYEDGKDIDAGLDFDDRKETPEQAERSARERGRRVWVRDFRRRLWWCTYSFDRLVSTCVGRPFGITDQVVTTEFPSLLDDKYITPTGFKEPATGTQFSYKHVTYHYIRLRLLQSEMLQVLQHQQAQIARASGANSRNPYMHTSLPSPFLSKFDSFRSWRIDIDKRLWKWKTSAPTKRETGVDFSLEFLELNYWQCIIMLYRQSLSVPAMFEGEYNTSDEVQSPSVHNIELREDEERVFLKVAEAGQRVLRLYRQLHRVHLVNYTFLATHHLFMAGISFLYAIWHSSIVRSRLTMDEVDFTILAATSVLGDLIEKCPPAEACRDAFDRMSKATVQMCMSTTGFSSSTAQGLNSRNQKGSSGKSDADYLSGNGSGKGYKRPKPAFDMGLNDLLGPITRTGAGTPGNITPGTNVKNEFEFGTVSNSLQNPNSQQQCQRQSISPTNNYAISPPLSTLGQSAADPSLLLSPTSNYSVTQQQTNQFHFSRNFTFSNQGMDFLSNNAGNGHMPGWGGTAEWGTGGGGDIGMGLGWEGADHDFSEGGNGGLPDLFDGFFFGGSGSF
ncbi:fungal-specific transcription factor domain-containing protein [Calycina marina]|uniref:Fungal-specific transcription factor domain-containing protein n=1 Tax=Calycina marina TaxID=1763456 RepID=A0A9P7YZN6_9HELO|nr:fungal-specific transcription factor domain-containing protein [Calycina marina]